MISAKTRKQVYELVPTDLEECLVWEFALDEEGEEGQDEATVRPCPDLKAPDVNEIDLASMVVRTEFRAADGTTFTGYCSPSYEDDLGYIQPIVVTPTGQVNFWFGGREPSADQITRCYSVLGKTAETLFPLRYSAFRPFSKLHAEGEITGFMYQASFGASPLQLR